MADSAEIVEPTSPTSGAAGPGGSARSAGPDRPAAASTLMHVEPSNCGKSTTLKMTNQLIEPTSGQITIGGEDVTGVAPVALRRTLGYAIQATVLFPHMTVTENIGLVPKMAGRPRAKVRDRGEDMSNTVAVLTVAMALIMDWLGTLVGWLLRPRGLEVD